MHRSRLRTFFAPAGHWRDPGARAPNRREPRQPHENVLRRREHRPCEAKRGPARSGTRNLSEKSRAPRDIARWPRRISRHVRAQIRQEIADGFRRVASPPRDGVPPPLRQDWSPSAPGRDFGAPAPFSDRARWRGKIQPSLHPIASVRRTHSRAENACRDRRGVARCIFEAAPVPRRNHFCRWRPSPAGEAAREGLPSTEKRIVPAASRELSAGIAQEKALPPQQRWRGGLLPETIPPRNLMRDSSL